MIGIRYVARCYDKTRDKWGIVDREAKKWVMVTPNQRWTSSKPGAQYCAEKWNEAGHRIYSGV